MKFFIDTADIDEIEEAYSWGIVDGITTNPSLIKKAAEKHGVRDLKEYIRRILQAAGNTPVSLEVLGGDSTQLYKQGMRLYELFRNAEVVIKVPVNPSIGDGLDFEGLKAIRQLRSQGIPVNVTLIMCPEQALLAAKAGATYVSPFCGRIDDHLRKMEGKEFDKTDYHPIKGSNHDNGISSGVHLVESILRKFSNYEFSTQVLAASTRNSRQIRELAELGCHIATIPFSVLKSMTQHDLTRTGMESFTKDIVPEYRSLFNAPQ